MKKQILSLMAGMALFTACNDLNKPQAKDEPQEATQDTAVVYRDGKTAADAAAGAAASVENAADQAGAAVDPDNWDLDVDLPNVRYEEVTLPDVEVRGNDRYSVYSVDEKVFFDTDKAELKPSAKNALEQISASIGKRFGGKDVRIMGFTDSRGDKNYNKELSAQRAEAVKNWLVKNGKVDASRVSLEPMGEAAPAASNATATGRQQNRRVEIAVRNS
ncbi:OmpA family protein [Hymenobacter latericus]|uniref:OmpA family protein n=1 Tax=Hymenobacter sp. YIM 151858-1 TaxID=2987688 RepID=UPI0022264080|nr:OmpA family protein [Hymenobacter sp. YIM 151858-1]UYZ58692.1 OmpA family protein [Hymenobacter sp. YIM 151858-1]